MPAAAAAVTDDRILVDNSNLAELKLTADEAVERILSRASKAAPTQGATASPPWKVSHFHTDLRLVLGYTASLLMIAVGVWSYFIEKEWSVNKGPTAVAVAVYLVLSAIQTADAYVQGNRIFYGSRKSANSSQVEKLILTSPQLPRHKTIKRTPSTPQPATIPPEYTLEAEYFAPTSASQQQQPKKGKVALGHFGEWITQEGEFLESVFEERLRAGLAKLLGE
ncbi:hypothetical protein V8E36_003051 [Tilletia maclaganii]